MNDYVYVIPSASCQASSDTILEYPHGTVWLKWKNGHFWPLWSQKWLKKTLNCQNWPKIWFLFILALIMVKSTLRHPLASIFEFLAISWPFLAIFVTKMAKNGHFCSCTKLLHVGTLNLCQKTPEMMPWKLH